MFEKRGLISWRTHANWRYGQGLDWIGDRQPSVERRVALRRGICASDWTLLVNFLALKGGKGVASTGGVLLFFQPLTAVICTLSWFALRATIFSSSLSSLASILLVSLLTWFNAPEQLPLFLGLSAIILVRHTDNLKRLKEGTGDR